MDDKQWEYKIISSIQTFNVGETLDKLGLEGWEMVSMCFEKAQAVFAFKREVKK